MKKEVKITLYYADWCGHCVNFKPEWNKFKEHILKIKKRNKDIEIFTKEYEDDELQKKGGGKINGKDIQGYPTVKIKLTMGDKSKEYNYDDYGKKDSKYMTRFIENVSNEILK